MSVRGAGEVTGDEGRGKSDPNAELERKALTRFWDALVMANSMLGQDLRAELVTDKCRGGGCQLEQSLRGKNSTLHYRLCVYDNGKSLTEIWGHAGGEETSVRYDGTIGLIIKINIIPDSSSRPVSVVYRVRDSDIDAILKDLCTGRPPFEHILQKCVRECRRPKSLKNKQKSFLSRLFEKQGGRKGVS